MTAPQNAAPQRRPLGPVARYEAARTLIVLADELGKERPTWAVEYVAEWERTHKRAG